MHELTADADYRSADDLRYWRSTSGFEVDFIPCDHTAVEIKATRTVTNEHLKGLKALAEEQRFHRYICVAMVDRPRTVDGITVLPWRHFFDALWAGEYR